MAWWIGERRRGTSRPRGRATSDRRELIDALVAEVAQRVQARPETPRSEAWKEREANRSRIEAWLSGERRLRLVRVHELLA